METIVLVASLLFALQGSCTVAFLAMHPSHRPFWPIPQPPLPLQANRRIAGAAKDAEEDLKLTLKIIMDFAERQAKREAESKTVEQPTSESSNEDVEEGEGEVEDEPTHKQSEAKDEEENKSITESKQEIEETESTPKVPKGFVIPTSKTVIPKSRTSIRTPPKAKKDAPPTLVSKQGLYSPDMAPSDLELHREFRFVDDSETTFQITDGKPSISCDGRIAAGATLELSHLPDNQTPSELYADTATEMALKLARHTDYATKMKDAWILNNHYDTSGVLSVYACLEPKLALQYADLMIAAAEAGDFGEWTTEAGVKLDLALQELRSRQHGEGISFLIVLTDKLPGLLKDFYETGGENYVDLWGPRYDKVMKSWASFQSNQAVLSAFTDDLVIVERSWNVPPVSRYALHRKLQEQGIELTTKRILHVLTDVTGSRYRYEKIGYGHVQRLSDRPSLPLVNAEKLVEELNAHYRDGSWQTGGEGPVAICQSLNITTTPVEEVAEYLLEHDDGL